jgi:D-apionolactonase
MPVQVIQLPLDVDLLPVKILKAGKLSCLYEKGNIRYVRYNDIELSRMIYIAVRDEQWGTASFEITNERIEQSEKTFGISYTAYYSFEKIVYKTHVKITGEESGKISFVIQGEALDNFLSNRIGICIHHPLRECSGKEIFITNTNNQIQETCFPELISPHQPFKDIVAMQWSPADGLSAHIQFSGDTFETEDQRNWSDSSFKTYSTPLSLPFPVHVKKGDQAINFSLHETGEVAVNKSEEISAEEKIPFPTIGYCRPGGSAHLPDAAIEYLRQIPFDHYRVELYINSPDWNKELLLSLSEAEQLKTKIELIAVIKNESDIPLLLDTISKNSNSIASLLLIDENKRTTEGQWLLQYAGQLRNQLQSVKIGYGSDQFFAELNRKRPQQHVYDFISFAINPQVHAFDNRSLAENLECQADLIKTIQHFSEEKPIHISPLTLLIRRADENGKLIHSSDERQYSSFIAWWTLMTTGNFSEAVSLTLYQTIGDAGLLKPINDSVYEFSWLYKMLNKIKEFKPVWIIRQEAKRDFGSELLLENTNEERLMIRLTMN